MHTNFSIEKYLLQTWIWIILSVSNLITVTVIYVI